MGLVSESEHRLGNVRLVHIEQIDDPGLVAMFGYPDSQERSTGLHVSTIIKALMRRLQPKRFKGEFKMTPSVEIGILFESVLEEALRRKYSTVRPPEIVSDEGIAMSPDGVNPTDCALEEFKTTYMSCGKGIVDENGQPLDKFVHWFVQVKAYCKWLDVRRTILRVLFLAGDYSRPIQPQFRSYMIEFSDEEIEENWAMLISVAREEGLLS